MSVYFFYLELKADTPLRGLIREHVPSAESTCKGNAEGYHRPIMRDAPDIALNEWFSTIRVEPRMRISIRPLCIGMDVFLFEGGRRNDSHAQG